MKIPSKVTPYKNSSLSLFPIILEKIEKQDMSPKDLYSKMKDKEKTFQDISEFVEILDCLFALGKIELRGDLLHYAGRNSM